jgi:DNA-binding response OmpR family regulator
VHSLHLESTPTMRILVVDDDDAICLTLRTILSTQKHEVTCVPNGTRAVEAAGGGGFDLALVDWTLPDISGPEVMAQIRALSPPTRVFISTGQEAFAVSQALGENQADGIVTKPFAVHELLEAVARLAPGGAGPAAQSE